MRRSCFVIILTLVSLTNLYAQNPEKFGEFWDKGHITTVIPSDVRHADLKNYLDRLKRLRISVAEVGRSNAGREIYQVEWGRGPLKVFMWSQMHGDEPTATSALIDMFAFLQKNRDKDWVKKMEERLTIRAVPMLNPDGAELFQRRNLHDIDVNRDALDLKTPEARLLKQLRDDWNPAIGFNLHNQGSLTTAGYSGKQATISLLMVYGDAAKTTNPGHERNGRIASAIAAALQRFIPGHIARYSDEWTATAFGDNFSAWGTPTILIETGGLQGKDERFLVKINFVAFLTALNSIATGSEKTQDPGLYASLPGNTSGLLYHYIFRRANILGSSPAEAPSVVDIAVNNDRRRASFSPPSYIRNIGDLTGRRGLQEFDVSAFNVIQRFGQLRTGELAELYFYRRDRTVDWAAADLEKQFPPDAVFSGGKWIKGEKLITRK
ncbi:MAG: M14 family zinc carboxypeptidase [Pyrinomonadaceae bacterium]